ncbi:MAG: alkaline phosphatase family protein, partial [Acidobacteriota bacterium]
MSVRTLLIGLDGGTFRVLDSLIGSGVMPFIGSFFAGGVRAPLRSIVPPLTPPAWTSLMTGRTPGQHGVFDFFRMDSPESRHIRFFTSQDVQCETIWSLASRHGLRVTSLNFPAMFPAPRLDGFVVPGWVPWRQLRLACWPEDLFDQLKTIPSFNPRELAMDIKLEERATEGCSSEKEYEPWIELHIRRERNWLEVLRYLTLRNPSALTAILFDGVDKLQHLCWRFLCPEDAVPLVSAWEFRVREACLEYFRALDGILAELCALAGPDANVLMASDHGFGPTWEVFSVNAWLAEKGYLFWSETAAADYLPAILGVGQVARHTWRIDWSRTRAFTATPTSNGICIVVNRDGKSPGISPLEYQAFRARLIEDLQAVRDPATGSAIVTGIWTREEAFAGPHQGYAPDLTLGLRDGGLVSILPSPVSLRKRAEIAGTHRPAGMFAARGPAFRRGAALDEMSILDVAPAILHVSGLPVPELMQGRVPREAFEPAWLASCPVAFAVDADCHADGLDGAGGDAITGEDGQAVLDRLRE